MEQVFIAERLAKCVEPREVVERLQPGLVDYLRNNRSALQTVISCVLPGREEVKALKTKSSEAPERSIYQNVKYFSHESVKWLQWLMFEEEPEAALEEIVKQNADTQGVCGVVWRSNDIAYRCRTCENDPTCAICVPCFKAGNHANHDYSMIPTGGGCCDCGDETAWKLEGFCSRHRGPGQVRPLPPKYVSSGEPVLSAVLIEWKKQLLLAAERKAEGKPKKWELQNDQQKVASMTTTTIVEMLLGFCKRSVSLLNFTATLIRSSPGLLDILLRTEELLYKKVVAELHELLFKLLGEPNFKYEFAKAFIKHYPTLVSEAIQEGTDGSNLSVRFNDYPALGNFSVQIFTVPTLIPSLVTEYNLLDMLLDNMKHLFESSVGEDGRILASKRPIANHLFVRLVEDIRFAVSHLEVAKYVARERRDISSRWIELLAFMQGMDPQKRVTSIHVEEENDHWPPLFMLELQMAHIHSLFVNGAASVDKVKWTQNEISISEQADSDSDDDVIRHAKVGRLSEESSMVRMVGRNSGADLETGDISSASTSTFQPSAMESCNRYTHSHMLPVPGTLSWLITECIKFLENWLASDIAKDSQKSPPLLIERSSRKPTQWRSRGIRGIIRDMHSPTLIESSPRVDMDANTNRGGMLREFLRRGRRIASHSEPEGDEDRMRTTILTGNDKSAVSEMDTDMASNEGFLGLASIDLEVEKPSIFRLEEWPTITYDVSRQEISFHIPLHRMLSLSLHKAMEMYTGELDRMEIKRNNLSLSLSGSCHDFFRLLLGDCHPYSFSAFVMEHILRLKVFCAQVHAGMWRRNGHSTLSRCDYYHSVRWFEDTLELDLFLLQCCAALAPPEKIVFRILERFGLSDYLSLHRIRPNEYEPTLTQEMLALIIRIVAERSFCGLSATESLRRELIRKLSVGDATRSQLLKALTPRLSDNKGLQEVLDNVATYSHPYGMQQGKYSLRKECWKELDLYHTRWNSRDLQIAEERYSRFCKASAVVRQLPRWRKPFYPLDSISKVATSKGVLQIIRAVVFYATFSKSSSDSRAPDGVLFAALHLLALGLDICLSTTDRKIHMQNNKMSLHGSITSTLSGETEAMLMDATNTFDKQESPPLVAYAKEVIDVGNIERPGVSNYQNLLSLLVLLMQKYESGSEQSIASEPGHCNIGVLISNLLEKFAELDHGCMHEIEKLIPSIVHRLSMCNDKYAGASYADKSERQGALGMSSGEYSGGKSAGKSEMPTYPSDLERKRALARERQAAVMAKMKAAQAKFAESVGSDTDASELKQGKSSSSVEEEAASEETASVVCALCRELGCKSPTAFLTLVQKSRLLSFAEKEPCSWERTTQLSGDDMAASEKGDSYGGAPELGSGGTVSPVELWPLIQSVLEGANGDGPLEVQGLLDILRIRLPLNAQTVDTSDDSDASLVLSADVRESDSAMEGDSDNGKDVASDLMFDGQSESASGSEDAVSAVLKEYFAAICKVMSKQQKDPENQSEVQSMESLAPSSQAKTFDGFGPSDCDGFHVSSCGHAVHQECLDRYLSSLRQRYSSRLIFEGLHIVDPSQGEFLCPVCRRLSNSVLPVLPGGLSTGMPDALSYGESSVTSFVESQSLQLQQALSLLRNDEELISKRGFHKAVSLYLPESAKVAIESLSQKLYASYFPGKSITKSASGRINQSLVLWDVFRYSLLAAELAARSSSATARSSETTLESLYRAVNCSRGSVLSLLLQVAKATQNQNRLTVLLRSRGMQLLVGSISCGVSRDTVLANSLTGNISSLLEHIEKGKDFPDIQFWKRVADPVLVHDPFSSLIWLLFCLPVSFPKATEPFISLVHLFYLVCLVQAVACAGRSFSPDSNLNSGSRFFIKSISTALSGAVLSQYLETDDGNLLVVPTELLIRRLTLPYLRRCALLYKLLYPSYAHLYETDCSEKSTVHVIDDHMENRDEILKELEELQYLENLFHIPLLETILEDKNVHALALRWCQHLSKEAGSRSYKHVVRCLPARPFELMRLPHLYQDLIQRYIKERCPSCKTVPDQPALCLLCGTLCCIPSRRECCRHNECLRHAMACGAGIGVFLLIRRTNILLQRSTRQAPWPSPYLDAFGEEDHELHRGKPLYLSKERYAALTQMVVSHGLDHSSHVLLQTTRDTVFII